MHVQYQIAPMLMHVFAVSASCALHDSFAVLSTCYNMGSKAAPLTKVSSIVLLKDCFVSLDTFQEALW